MITYFKSLIPKLLLKVIVLCVQVNCVGVEDYHLVGSTKMTHYDCSVSRQQPGVSDERSALPEPSLLMALKDISNDIHYDVLH